MGVGQRLAVAAEDPAPDLGRPGELELHVAEGQRRLPDHRRHGERLVQAVGGPEPQVVGPRPQLQGEAAGREGRRLLREPEPAGALHPGLDRDRLDAGAAGVDDPAGHGLRCRAGHEGDVSGGALRVGHVEHARARQGRGRGRAPAAVGVLVVVTGVAEPDVVVALGHVVEVVRRRGRCAGQRRGAVLAERARLGVPLPQRDEPGHRGGGSGRRDDVPVDGAGVSGGGGCHRCQGEARGDEGQRECFQEQSGDGRHAGPQCKVFRRNLGDLQRKARGGPAAEAPGSPPRFWGAPRV